MDENIKKIFDRVKDIPGLKVGFVFCDPMTMTVDCEVHDYESAERLLLNREPRRPDWPPEEIMPIFWIRDEDDEEDEYSPAQYK